MQEARSSTSGTRRPSDLSEQKSPSLTSLRACQIRAGGLRRGGDPRLSAPVEVTKAWCPIVAPQAAGNISTAAGGQLPVVCCRNSSGETSSNASVRPGTSQTTRTCSARVCDTGPRRGCVTSGMPVRKQRPGGDVAVVDGGGLHSGVRPPDHTPTADRGPPLRQCIQGEHPRADEGPLEPAGRDQPLGTGVQTAIGFCCWKNRCGVLCGGRERRTAGRRLRDARRLPVPSSTGRSRPGRRPRLLAVLPSDSGSVRSPTTISAVAGSTAAPRIAA